MVHCRGSKSYGEAGYRERERQKDDDQSEGAREVRVAEESEALAAAGARDAGTAVSRKALLNLALKAVDMRATGKHALVAWRDSGDG